MLKVASRSKAHNLTTALADISTASSTFLAAFQEETPRSAPKATRRQQTKRPSIKANKKKESWTRGHTVTKQKAQKYISSRTNSPIKKSGSPTKKSGSPTKKNGCPKRKNFYEGPNRSLDRLTKGSRDAELYFEIRKACNRDCDDVTTLKKLLPQRECEGQDFGVWPRQHLLLHGLVKQGCVDCVKYLLSIGISVNSRRMKDDCTPLHIAFYNLQGTTLDKMVQMLLDHGADTKATNKWSEAPCMFKFKEHSLKENVPEPKKPQLQMLSPCGVADLELDTPISLDLGPPATPTPKAVSAGKVFVYENESLKLKQIRQLAEVVSLAASSYGVFKVASQISDWKISIRSSPLLTARTGRAACASPEASAFHEATLRRIMA